MMFVALLLVATMALTPNVRTQGRREKETEMIWRGKQYVRGIRLYYQKNHKFPTQLEDLYKPKTGIRFMRQPFKDPMNPVDGSWRLIYVGPNGQLIGSLKNRAVNAAGQAVQGFGGALGANSASAAFGNQSSFGNSSFGNSSFGNASFGASSGGRGASFGNSSFSTSSFGNSSFGNSSFGSSSFGSNSTPTAAPPPNPSSDGPNDPNAQNPDSSSGDMSTPQSLAASDMPTTIIGGNIIGVGSKVNEKSFRWYEKAKNYRQFEFVWDPSVDSLTGQSIGAIPNNPNSNSIGTPAGSSPFSNSASPFSTGAPNANTPNSNPSPSGPGQAPLNPSAPDPNANPPLQAPPPS